LHIVEEIMPKNLHRGEDRLRRMIKVIVKHMNRFNLQQYRRARYAILFSGLLGGEVRK